MSSLSSQIAMDSHGFPMEPAPVALGQGQACHVEGVVAATENHRSIRPWIQDNTKLAGDHVPRVLLVEDNPDVRLILRTMLTYKGFRVETAVDGQDAVEKANMDRHDLVVMDLQMPRMDGFEALTQLRESGFTKPILALTAHATLHDRSRCLAFGFSEFMTKPVDTRALYETLQRLISPPA